MAFPSKKSQKIRGQQRFDLLLFRRQKNLYQEVLNEQSNLFLNLIARVSSKDIAPLAKLREYITAISEVQKLHPHRIHLIYRELLTPTFMCDSFIKNRLYKIHKFMSELVTEAIADGSIRNNMQPTHVAFTLESIIVFFFSHMIRSVIWDI